MSPSFTEFKLIIVKIVGLQLRMSSSARKIGVNALNFKRLSSTETPFGCDPFVGRQIISNLGEN